MYGGIRLFPSGGKALLLDEVIHYFQSLQQQAEETNEWTSLITSLLLEGISAIFDELGFVLMGMVVAFLALLLSVVDLIREARKEQGSRQMEGAYHPVFIGIPVIISGVASPLAVLLRTLDWLGLSGNALSRQ